ncbi:probable G-protein coupled receptor tkr-1 [Bradysia coprophila]|uniref:probable G-protein coupled receptor tkr-1 n=1 Tax=Bradysia coprophila TaxID=38358 RepID=UPI00187DD57A|nr:probable G-protein coupled receptor tkr-1 [Bradysia coprophila]
MSNTTIATDTRSAFIQDSFVLFLYIITGIVAILGNGFVLAVILRNRTRHFSSVTYTLIANMALSDLIAGLIIFAQFGFCSTEALSCGLSMEFMCLMIKLIQIVSYFVSTYTMTAIAYERLHVMKSPFAPKTHPKWYIAISWIVGIMYITICTFNVRVSEFFTPTELISCKVLFQIGFLNKPYVRTIRAVLLMLLQFVIPLGITSVMYTWLLIQLRCQKIVGEATDDKIARKKKSNRNLTIMLMFTVIAFAVSWLPVHIWHLVMFFQIKLKGSKCNSSLAYSLCYWFAVSSCAWNPFIYCLRGSKFRRTISDLKIRVLGSSSS